MDKFYRTHAYLVEHTDVPVRRELMGQIDWNHPLIGIKGTRGVGKTTFLLQYAKEKYGTDRSCLYINMNNLYFSTHSLYDFAADFVHEGGRVLLIDQIFKHPGYAAELRMCHDRLPELKIVFTGSSVMDLESREESPEICDIIKSYNLRGFSFREFLNLQAGTAFASCTLQDVLEHHEEIAREVTQKVHPLKYLQDYIHHGFYPFFLEKSNFSENLLKTMNMMVEVDVLLIKQIDLKYLSKIKKLLYLLTADGPKAPNVSSLATEIETSRATVMNYIKYLQDARLINMVYQEGESFPKKPVTILPHNTNLIYCIYPVRTEEQYVLDTFFVNNLWGNGNISTGDKRCSFVVDGDLRFKLCCDGARMRKDADAICVMHNEEVGHKDRIPLWMFGFLY